MNKVFLSGNLTRDPELKTGGKTEMAYTGIAVKRPFNKDETDFFNLTTFGKTAEFLNKYFRKGSRLLVEGHLRFSSYENKDGKKVSSVEVIVDNIEFAGDGKKKADDDFDGVPVDDDDTPF